MYREARNDYDLVLKAEPKNDLIYYNRGLDYYDAGEFQKAIDDFTSAIKIDPDFGNAFLNRGIANYLLGIDGCSDLMEAKYLGAFVHPKAIEGICN